MELLEEIQKRYTVRKFTGKKINDRTIERILEAGRRSPSAKNRQAWRFIVIDKDDMKQKIQSASYGQEAVGTAGCIIALCTTNIDYHMPNGQPSYAMDISFAASFMMLQAIHEGLGTGIITTYDEHDVKHILTVPYSMRIVLLLLIGYPAEQMPLQERLPIERIVAYNHW